MYGDCLSHIERFEQLTRKNLAGNTLIQVRKLCRETPPITILLRHLLNQFFQFPLVREKVDCLSAGHHLWEV